MKVTLFGNRLSADVIKMRSSWIRVGLNSMTGVLVRRGKFGHRDTEDPHRENGR